MLYVDTTYLFRVYSTEPGHEEVKALLSQADRLAVAWHDPSCSSCRLYVSPIPANLWI